MQVTNTTTPSCDIRSFKPVLKSSPPFSFYCGDHFPDHTILNVFDNQPTAPSNCDETGQPELLLCETFVRNRMLVITPRAYHGT